ncbi:hypothetical protein Csac_2220 [Caldicellulosiruptor saccharolyticus DSM 8903]|uniref:Uncharacterized protein n=1 Tax=Caldicellulosiruptor saccharolyticus (strain ATCC 43494 / DSM 8903 / Tp8T 6331) TaxID=351627 RepID=A4XLL3_CALS8|nr:hypothetical protein [Caldicellulosiruptor saccharolyticus]ABP67798.1 hypothetical protein Csac_2220 [Caldicellulosiruptor saccharolyticus DSM 8903]
MKWIVRIALVVWIVIGLALYIPVFKEYHMNKVQFINVWTYNVQLKNDYEYLINVKKLSEEQAKEKLGLKADTILPSKEALASYYKDYVKPFETAFYEQLEKTTITFLVFTIIIGMVVVGFDWTYRKEKR